MQISQAKVHPIEIRLRHPLQMARLPKITSVTAIFIRLELRDGRSAWGCAVAHPALSGEKPEEALRACQACADRAPDLHPTNIEYSLAELAPLTENSRAARTAFDLAFHDLLGMIAGLPLYRLLGGYRNRIQTSATVPLTSLTESVERARQRAEAGFRMLKIKGGMDPDEDVQRVRAIKRTLPALVLRLDADGGYTVQQALDVARALAGHLEMLEQPTPFGDLEALRQVSEHSPLPILADQSVAGPSSALNFAAQRAATGLSIKMSTCGGLRCARQVDAIARAAQITSMVNCIIEPALLIAAGLSFALSSPNVQYSDLDGHLDLIDDPTRPGFRLQDGWLIASETVGLGCTVDLG